MGKASSSTGVLKPAASGPGCVDLANFPCRRREGEFECNGRGDILNWIECQSIFAEQVLGAMKKGSGYGAAVLASCSFWMSST